MMVNFSEDISPLLLIWFVVCRRYDDLFSNDKQNLSKFVSCAIFGSTGCVQLLSYYYDMNL